HPPFPSGWLDPRRPLRRGTKRASSASRERNAAEQRAQQRALRNREAHAAELLAAANAPRSPQGRTSHGVRASLSSLFGGGGRRGVEAVERFADVARE